MKLASFAILASLSAAVAQQAPLGTPQNPKTARLEGIVVSLTGGPIERAQVRLTRRSTVENGVMTEAANYATTTDEKGKFVFEGVSPGTIYNLAATRVNFAEARYGARSNSGPQGSFTLAAGQSLTGVTLTMTPQSVITGRVTDTFDDPVTAATVILARQVYQRGARQLVMMSTAPTDDKGDFRIPNVLPGRYYLVVTKSRPPDAADKVPVPTYFPNAITPQGAAAIDVSAGQDLSGVRMQMQEARLFKAKGKLTGDVQPGTTLLATTKFETNASMVIQTSVVSQLQRSQAQVQPDGSFELRGLFPGLYAVQAASPGQPGQPARNWGSFDLQIANDDLADLEVKLFPPGNVEGTIRLDEGDLQKLQPAYNAATAQQGAATALATVHREAAVTGVRMVVGLSDSTPMPVIIRPGATLKDDSTFLLESVPAGRYTMTIASLPAGTYVKSIRYGGTDVTTKVIDMSGGASGRFDIVLGTKAASVSGTVVDEKGESPPATALCLWPLEPDANALNAGTRVVIADQNGKFQFGNLRPGTWYAVAFEDIEWGIARERPYLDLLRTEATKFELKEGASTSGQVKIVPISKLKLAEAKLP